MWEHLQQRDKTKTRANFGWRGLLKCWQAKKGMPFFGSQIRLWCVTHSSTTELSWTASVHTLGKTGTDSWLWTKISAAHKNVAYIHTGSSTDISISGETLLLATSLWKVVVFSQWSVTGWEDTTSSCTPRGSGWTSGGIYSQKDLLSIGMNCPGRQSDHSWRCSRNNLALSAKV